MPGADDESYQNLERRDELSGLRRRKPPHDRQSERRQSERDEGEFLCRSGACVARGVPRLVVISSHLGLADVLERLDRLVSKQPAIRWSLNLASSNSSVSSIPACTGKPPTASVRSRYSNGASWRRRPRPRCDRIRSIAASARTTAILGSRSA